MRFEKWQALGNDYLIVEASNLSFPLTAAAVRRLCDRHAGPGADGVLELATADAPGFVARLRIFNPDGSEAELVLRPEVAADACTEDACVAALRQAGVRVDKPVL
jgi:diaminopimelate epimerase